MNEDTYTEAMTLVAQVFEALAAAVLLMCGSLGDQLAGGRSRSPRGRPAAAIF